MTLFYAIIFIAAIVSLSRHAAVFAMPMLMAMRCRQHATYMLTCCHAYDFARYAHIRHYYAAAATAAAAAAHLFLRAAAAACRRHLRCRHDACLRHTRRRAAGLLLPHMMLFATMPPCLLLLRHMFDA